MLHWESSWIIVARMGQLAVFWDRDNTLIEDPGYIDHPDKVILRPGAAAALRRIAEAGYRNIVVSNQSGIARGKLDEPTLKKIHARLQERLAEQSAHLDAIYYCPYLDGEEAVVERYRRDSHLRKPKPGMLLQAASEHKIDLVASWVVGDAVRDAQAGRSAGCRTIIVPKVTGERAVDQPNGSVDFVADSLEQAVEIILSHPARSPRQSPTALASETPTDSVLNQMNTTLQEILGFHRMVDRRAQAEEFSFARLLGVIVQMLALGTLIWSVLGWIQAPDTLLGTHLIRLLLCIVLQLLALTFFIVGQQKPR